MCWINDYYYLFPNDALTHKNWQELKDIYKFLYLFFQVTKRQGRENTLNKVLSYIDFLIHHFQQAKQKYRQNLQFTARLLVLWFKFDKYYKLTNNIPLYAAAILLYPALRRRYLDQQQKKQKEYIKPIIDLVRNIQAREFKTLAPKQVDIDELDKFERQRKQIYYNAINQDKFERFISVGYITPLTLI